MNGDIAWAGSGSGHAVDEAVAARTVERLGWRGVALPEMRLLGRTVVAVVDVDVEVHRERVRGGHGPELDGDVLATWERPPAVRLSGTVTALRRGFRDALQAARRWRAFGPAAVLLPAPLAGDPMFGWECELYGVGLVAEGEPTAPIVPADPERSPATPRHTMDRWICEHLYAAALASGHVSG